MISAPASDDEGSTAATDGSTLRTSPAEHGGSVGSESGGSAIDSVAGEHSGGWFQEKQMTLNTIRCQITNILKQHFKPVSNSFFNAIVYRS